ncbi:hypothetical protein [Arthrobacter sp. VKM Ac-2550]|uniref:hypothetical protein n=1 Tax=Crystallibacter permensis TaxID=1938888 RepID=UPI002226C89D|nr:hypothetical protein [Arthrobacter sp. VKM Ac-2550]MCW2131846.1 hypothetical protein [Arthrobacter sp. VKM Ac-2550]
MPATSLVEFELEKVSVNAEGALTLTGTTRRSDIADSPTDLAFAIVGRKSKAAREYIAHVNADPERFEVRGTIPMGELGLEIDDLADVFLIVRTLTGESRIRLTWDLPNAHWLPYPTKFGNLSLKRKQS